MLGFITQKLRLSPLVGYLLAGILVGPHSPGFVADASTAAQCAEIGVILLMFGVGLHFHLKDLLAVGAIAGSGAMLLAHAERVGASLRRQGVLGRTVTLKVKFADFRQITRSRTLAEGINATETIFDVGRGLLRELALPQPVRLIGLGVSGFDAPSVQLLLPGAVKPATRGLDPQVEARRRRLDAALDTLRGKFGKQAVQRGRLFTPAERAAKPTEASSAASQADAPSGDPEERSEPDGGRVEGGGQRPERAPELVSDRRQR